MPISNSPGGSLGHSPTITTRQRAATYNDVTFIPPQQHQQQQATLAAAVYEGEDEEEVEEQEDYISTPMPSPARSLQRGKPVQAQDPLDIRNDSMDLSRSSSAMKKAFTEFHNSATTGQDSGQAYLGDDPSHHKGGQHLYWRATNDCS
jgi:hypothetical protein